jgi:hypothetical protein
MRPLVSRRVGLTIALLVACACAYWVWRALGIALRPVGIYTGLLLLGLVFFLTIFNARKKLPFLPLMRASTWLQVHIYIGWFCFFVFLLHINFRLPGGPMEIILAAVFCIVVASGAFGLFISRWLPARMARSGEPLIYERMPTHRRYIRERLEELILKAEVETESSTLGDFYLKRLKKFFDHSPSAWQALALREMGPQHIIAEMNALSRYLNSREKEIAAELHGWIEQKQNLDFQYSAQRLLKLWLFVHILFTCALILLGTVHGIIAALYAGLF